MPDAIRAITELMEAPVKKVEQRIYNIRAFSPTAADLKAAVDQHFPGAIINFTVDENRQAIVDSWPSDVDQSAAQRDWQWQPRDDFESAFANYLVPAIKARYDL